MVLIVVECWCVPACAGRNFFFFSFSQNIQRNAQNHRPGGLVYYTSSSLTLFRLLILWTKDGSLERFLPPVWDAKIKPQNHSTVWCNIVGHSQESLTDVGTFFFLSKCSFRHVLQYSVAVVKYYITKLAFSSTNLVTNVYQVRKWVWISFIRGGTDFLAACRWSLYRLIKCLSNYITVMRERGVEVGGRSGSNIAVYKVAVIHLRFVCTLCHTRVCVCGRRTLVSSSPYS